MRVHVATAIVATISVSCCLTPDGARASLVDAVPDGAWLDPSSTLVRIVDSRPWGGLPVVERELRLRAAVGARWWIEGEGIDRTASRVRDVETEVSTGLRLDALRLGVGLHEHRVRVGEGLAHVERRTVLTLAMVARRLCTFVRLVPGGAAGRSAQQWTAGAALPLFDGGTLSLQREPDRWGSGARWTRALEYGLLHTLVVRVAWRDDEVVLGLDLRHGAWRLHWAGVASGARGGGRAIAVGWSR